MPKVRPIVGVLALHGDFAEHMSILSKLGADAREVRTIEDLKSVDRLIIPGGESTVISKLLILNGLASAIKKRVKDKSLSIFGTCAGLILLAKNIRGFIQPPSLKLLDVTVHRNAYGRQLQSFPAHLRVKGIARKVHADFIRAPKITQVGKAVKVLAKLDGAPVIIQQGNILAASCHPEVCGDSSLHKYFLSIK